MPFPLNFDHLIQRGVRHHQAGELAQAQSMYEQVLALQPGHPDALHLLGVVALQAGDPMRALPLLEQAVAQRPRNAAFQSDLGQALFNLRRYDLAQAAYIKAAKLEPRNPRPQVSAASCLALSGEFAQAEARLRKIVQRFPRDAPAWFNLANAVRDQGRPADAVPLYQRALDWDSGFADAHNNLGGVLHALERFDDAEQEYRRCLELQPNHVIGHLNLAGLLIDRGAFAEGEAACRKVQSLAPDLVEVRPMLASALAQQGRMTEVLELARVAVEHSPLDTKALLSLGSTLCALGHEGEGRALYDRAVAEAGDKDSPRYFRAMAHLALGDTREAWADYACRPARLRFAARHPEIALATALPEDLSGRHVCVLSEQGIGDEIFFLRFAPLLKQRGARITYRATAKIASLLARCAPLDNVIGPDDPLPAAEFTVLVGDLPLAVTGNLVEPLFPPPLTLTPGAERVTEMRASLQQLGPPPYIGLTWRGGIPPKEQRGALWGHYKQIPLQAYAQAVSGVPGTLLVLQRRPEPGEIGALHKHTGRPLHDCSALNDDLEGMLALLAFLDEYVAVSNTNVHLRAGVGARVRVLLPCPAEWRWMAEGDESPWFPGIPIYRQRPDGDWGPAVTRLASDLAAR